MAPKLRGPSDSVFRGAQLLRMFLSSALSDIRAIFWSVPGDSTSLSSVWSSLGNSGVGVCAEIGVFADMGSISVAPHVTDRPRPAFASTSGTSSSRLAAKSHTFKGSSRDSARFALRLWPAFRAGGSRASGAASLSRSWQPHELTSPEMDARSDTDSRSQSKSTRSGISDMLAVVAVSLDQHRSKPNCLPRRASSSRFSPTGDPTLSKLRAVSRRSAADIIVEGSAAGS
mmetsp:Transcript_2063/g.5801  ORF Transcript_2063/g.5801 Transcript_2063/m.5801 type:complete len:229 (-) Transcript_2063:61-747(-)